MPNVTQSPYAAGDLVHAPSTNTARSPFIDAVEADVEHVVTDAEHEAEKVEADVEEVIPEAEKVFGEVEHDIEEIHPA